MYKIQILLQIKKRQIKKRKKIILFPKMSQLIQLPDRLSVDPRLTIGSQKQVEIRKGAARATTQRTTASSVSNSQLVFNVQLNSANNTIVDPYCYLEIPIIVTITGGTAGTTVQQYVDNNFALRQYPLASVMSSCQVQINNQSVSSNPSQFIHQLSQFQDFLSGKGEAALQSIVPIMPDQSPAYNDLLGSAASPLNGYAAGRLHYSSSRGEFNSDFITVTGTTGTWQFTTTIREPIFNPLLEYDPAKKREGIPYVNLMNIQCNFLSYLSGMFSLNAAACPLATITSVNINSATLVQTWLTVPLTMSMPDLALRSFNSIVCNQTNQTAFSASEQRTIQSQSYSVNQIPKKIWLYVCESQTSKDTATGYTKADFCFSIESVSILWNNNANLMANMSAADLYNSCMASEGSAMTYVQSRKFTGAVLCLDPAKLFGLQDDQAPGLIGNFQFQVQVQCTNISGGSVTPVMFVDWALDTLMTIDKSGTTNLVQGFLKPEDVLNANKLPAHAASFAESDIYGGSFWDKVKEYASKALGFVRDNKLISKGLAALPQTAAYAPVAAQLGFGNGGRRTSRKEMLQASLRY